MLAPVLGLCVIACGEPVVPSADGNEAERHRCPLNGKYFERRGYRVLVIGAPNTEGSQIVAYK